MHEISCHHGLISRHFSDWSTLHRNALAACAACLDPRLQKLRLILKYFGTLCMELCQYVSDRFVMITQTNSINCWHLNNARIATSFKYCKNTSRGSLANSSAPKSKLFYVLVVVVVAIGQNRLHLSPCATKMTRFELFWA